jgi:hypothetical protein
MDTQDFAALLLKSGVDKQAVWSHVAKEVTILKQKPPAWIQARTEGLFKGQVTTW